MVGYNSILDVQFDDGVIVEPITLTETKDFCKIDIDTDDAIITEMIISARQMCEDYTNIGFVPHQVAVNLDNPNGSIYLPYGPFIDMISVEDAHGNSLIIDVDYTIGGNAFKRLLTPRQENLTLTYQTGYEILPERLRLALLNTVYYIYDNRAQSINHIYDKNVPTIGNLGPISEMILKPLRRVI
jgi:uncharacterized phiE125 gp8 family phage protein